MFILLSIVACEGAPNDDTGAPSTCDLVLSTSVLDGAVDIPGNRPVVITLSEADPTATLTASASGNVTASEDGLTLTWTPTPPLDPLTDVTLEISTCAGTSSIAYRTAEYGGPLDAGVDLAANGYRFDLAAGTIVQPPTGAALLALLGDTGTEILLGMTTGVSSDTGSDSAGLNFRVAVVADGAQDACSRTLDLAGGRLDRGWFDFGPEVATFSVYETPVVLQDLAFGGALAADGSGINAGWLRASIEVEALAVAYAEGDVEAACAFFAGAGATCAPCPDGEGDCLALEVADLAGFATGTPVYPVTEGCPE